VRPLNRSRVTLILAVVVGLLVVVTGAVLVLARVGPFGGHPDAQRSSPSPSPTPSPRPTPKPPVKLGKLKAGLTIAVVGTNLFAQDAQGAWTSTDSGRTWTAVTLPRGGTGLTVDPKDPKHFLVGGGGIQESADGGATWKAAAKQPAGAAPMVPMGIAAADKNTWFALAGGHLQRTRDAGGHWKAVDGLPSLSSAQLVPMTGAGRYVLAGGGQAFELTGFGTQVKALPKLPSGNLVRVAVLGKNDPPNLVGVSDNGKAFAFGGTSWTAIDGGLSGPVAGTATGYGWLGDGGMKLGSPAAARATSDGGHTWKPASGLPTQSMEAVAAVTPNGKVALAYFAGGDMYRSADGGLTWIFISRFFRS